ncbi:hypothetical protein AB3N59_03180 [Leptospira sp. WS92.C1]
MKPLSWILYERRRFYFFSQKTFQIQANPDPQSMKNAGVPTFTTKETVVFFSAVVPAFSQS